MGKLRPREVQGLAQRKYICQFICHGGKRSGLEFSFPACWLHFIRIIVITQSGILLSEIHSYKMSIKQLTAVLFVIGENYEQSKSH